MKQSVSVLISCIFVIITAVSGCDGGTTAGNGDHVDGDVSADGDAESGDEIETMEEDLETSDKTDGSEDGDIEVVDDDIESEIEVVDGDAEETAEDVEMVEEEQQASAPRFTGFTASGGTAASDSHRLIFRMAPAALVVKASNGTVNLNATITPQSYK